jgi:hypothetical protein
MKYCTICGAKLESSNHYCTNCGADVRGEVAINPKITVTRNNQSAKIGHSAEQLKIDPVGSTILGLITLGIWWTLFIKKWSELHLKYYEKKLVNNDEEQFIEILKSVRQSTNRSVQLSTITLVMLSAGLIILIITFIYEVVLDIGGFPLPEEPFWFYCWVSLSMLAVTWASVLLGLFKILKLQSFNWFPLNGSSEIVFVTAIWCIVALGLLPLLIFPPVFSGSVNKYVSILTDKRIL